MALTLTPDMAKAVLEGSEGRPDGNGGEGHTLRKHVKISNAELRRRFEEGSPSGELKIFTAFMDTNQAAAALASAVGVLANQPFIRDFDRTAEGAMFDSDTIGRPAPWLQLPAAITVRYGAGAGKIPLQQFRLWAIKMKDRPHGLHVITFYMRMWL